MSSVALTRSGVSCYKIASISGISKEQVSTVSGIENAPAPNFFSDFEDGTGTTVADLSPGTAHNGSFVGDAEWYSSPAGGTWAVATGSGEAVKLSDHNDLEFHANSAFSFSTYTATNSPNYSGIVVKRAGSGGSYRGLALFAHNGVIDFYLSDTYSSEALHIKGTGTSTNIKDGNWHHIAVSYDGSTNASGVRIWVDNVLHTTGNGKMAVQSGIDTLDALSDTTNSIDLYLSNSSDTQVYPSGGVDSTAIWTSSELTASQVEVLYNSGTPIDVRRGL